MVRSGRSWGEYYQNTLNKVIEELVNIITRVCVKPWLW